VTFLVSDLKFEITNQIVEDFMFTWHKPVIFWTEFGVVKNLICSLFRLSQWTLQPSWSL